MKLVIVMPFYDKTYQRECITSLQLRNYIFTRQYIENKYKDVKMHFLLIGSEKEKSLNLIKTNGFSNDEYCEFDQSPYGSVLDIIENKYIYGLSIAKQRHPDMDILFINGSNDIVDYLFYENAIAKFKNDKSPQIYGINGFKKGGSSYFCENNINNILVLNDKSFKNKIRYFEDMLKNENDIYQEKKREIHDSKKSDKEKTVLLNKIKAENIKKFNSRKEGQNHIEYIHSTAFIGGIYGFNKKLLEIMNYQIVLPQGNEYMMEESCLKNGAKIVYCHNYFINFKASDSDVTPFKLIDKLYGPLQVRFKELDNNTQNFINRILN